MQGVGALDIMLSFFIHGGIVGCSINAQRVRLGKESEGIM